MGSLWQTGFQAQRFFCQRTHCRDEQIHKAPSFQGPESFYKMKELAICLFIFFKRRSSLGAFYSAYPTLCAFFKETPQMLHTLNFQLLAGGMPVSVALFLLVCNLLLIMICWNTACCSPLLNWSSAQCCSWPRESSEIATLEGLTFQQSHRNTWSSISSILSSWEAVVVLQHREQFSAHPPTPPRAARNVYLSWRSCCYVVGVF